MQQLTALQQTPSPPSLSPSLRDSMKCDVCQWDVCMLPLRTASVDVVVTDMVTLTFSHNYIQFHKSGLQAYQIMHVLSLIIMYMYMYMYIASAF